MLLSKGIYNNRDPSTIYRSVEDIEKFFKDISSTNGENICISTADKLSAVSASHRIMTNSFASIPFMIRQKKGKERIDSDHYLERYLKIRANEYMTPFMVQKIQMSQAFWHGIGFILIERDKNGRVCGLLPLPSEGHSRYIDSGGNLWYSFSVTSETPGKDRKKLTRKFMESELIIHRFESYNGYSGVGMLEMARNEISTDIMAQKYSAKFYKNGARISGIVEVTGEVDDDSREIIRKDFERMSSGIDNAFRVAVLDLGMKYTQLGISQRDSQFIETREFSIDEVSRFSGIPQYMLQAGKQSYQSNEQQQLDFVVNTLTPHLVQSEQEWGYKLFSELEINTGHYMKKNVNSLLRGDIKSRAEYYQKMIGMSIYNTDECRALEDESPLPDGQGQHFWMSKNYDTVENIVKGVDI